MLPVADALAIVLQQARRLPATEAPLDEAGGRVLAADVVAPDPLPPFAASVKDGYAVVAADGAGVYPDRRRSSSRRGRRFPGRTGYRGVHHHGRAHAGGRRRRGDGGGDGTCRRGAGTAVRIKRSVRAGDDVRQVGVDVQAGQTLLRAGERLGAAEMGLLATAGMASVSCPSSTACGRAVDRRRVGGAERTIAAGPDTRQQPLHADGGGPRGGGAAGRPGRRPRQRGRTCAPRRARTGWKRMYL